MFPEGVISTMLPDCRVAGGLDSLVLGEGQILAQVKQVYKVGQTCQGFGRHLNGLFKQVNTHLKQLTRAPATWMPAVSSGGRLPTRKLLKDQCSRLHSGLLSDSADTGHHSRQAGPRRDLYFQRGRVGQLSSCRALPDEAAQPRFCRRTCRHCWRWQDVHSAGEAPAVKGEALLLSLPQTAPSCLQTTDGNVSPSAATPRSVGQCDGIHLNPRAQSRSGVLS